MASTFQLGDEQPSLKPTNPTKAAANSFNNLFGPPVPAKVGDVDKSCPTNFFDNLLGPPAPPEVFFGVENF